VGINVISTPSWQDNMDTYRTKAEKFAGKAGSGYSYVNYDDPQALIDALAGKLAGTDDCLAVLEIVAHANPSSCNGIYLVVSPATPKPNMSAKDFAAKLKALRLCPGFKLYLTGCNTGCTENGAGPGLKPMAQELASALGKSVYGVSGYVDSGTHATGDVSSSTSHGGNSYPGASGSSGDSAYKEHKP
jgi:hypothetical protein